MIEVRTVVSKNGFLVCLLATLLLFPILSMNSSSVTDTASIVMRENLDFRSRFSSLQYSSAQLDFEDKMVVNYSESINVKIHSIIINQTAPHKLLVEELITFKNTGNEDYTGKLYASLQDKAALTITLFGAYINGSFKPLGIHRTDDFVCMNLTLDNVTIEPGGELQVVYRYELLFSTSSECCVFELTFLYVTDHLGIKVETLEDYEAEGIGDLVLVYETDSGVYITDSDVLFSVYRGKTISIEVFKTTNDQNDSNLLLVLMIIALLSLVVVGIVWYKRNKGSKTTDSDEAKKKRGRPKGKPSNSSQLKKLQREKETILKAIKKLDDNHRAGEIDEELFDEMNSAYKKKAKEILKRIEKVQLKNTK